MDALDTILRSIQIEAAIVSRSRLRTPWALQTAGSPDPIFHAVVEGRMWVQRDSDDRGYELAAGEAILLPRGDGHVLADGPATPPVPRGSQRELRDGNGFPLLEHGGEGAETRILSGTFQFHGDVAGTLRDLLPPLVVARAPGDAERDALATTLRLLDGELDIAQAGSSVVLERLTAIVFVHLLRHIARANDGDPEAGWFSAITDEHIGRTLALMHGEPAAPWSLDQLAGRVGLTRSSFCERFTRLVGESPTRYLARWRSATAADLLREQRTLSVAAIAHQVGYGSEDAFSRAFRRYVGVTPGRFRRLSGALSRPA
ncbi:MAG TPA: AraC family transcriptional regulator [Polyangiaceae bacterium]|nr:AraC family transcriptional regulator [Polyangiaceae bacterium]